MKKLIMAVVLAVASLGGALVAPVSAAGGTCPPGTMNANQPYVNSVAECNIPAEEKGDGNQLFDTVKLIINVVLGMVGLIAAVMIIIGGINFTISQGDASKVTKAKNTLLYGIVGLIISLLAFTIVNFVLTSVFSSPAEKSDDTGSLDITIA